MKQEYIVIPNQNQWLQDLIGKSYNQKLINETGKKLFINHGLETGFAGFGKAIVTVSDTKTKEILRIGGSSILQNLKTGKKIADLSTDNFMRFVAGLMRPVTNVDQSFSLIDRNNVTKGLRMYGNNTGFGFIDVFSVTSGTTTKGMQMQVGSGSSAPVRTDFNIETAFGSSPESLRNQITTNGVYDQPSGQISAIVAIVAGGAGTVNECGFGPRFFSSTGIQTNFMWFHDAISPAVPFVAA